MTDNGGSEKGFRVKVYSELKQKYHDQLKDLFYLCFGTNEPSVEEGIDFLYEFDQIIEGYKGILGDPDYLLRLRECRDQLIQASDYLDDVEGKLTQLQGSHTLQWIHLFESTLPNAILRRKISDSGMDHLSFVFDTLRLASEVSSRVGLALTLIGGPLIQDRRRGRPMLPYFMPVAELIEFWEKWTRRSMPHAKAHGKDDKKTRKRTKGPSAVGMTSDKDSEFIRVALKMIDPASTTSNVITSINGFRKLRREMSEHRSSLNEGLNRLLEAEPEI